MENFIQPIFIGGCPRSGTTMLGDLLSRHPEIGFTPELNFKLPLYKRISYSNFDAEPQELLKMVINHPKSKVNNFQLTLNEKDLLGINKYEVGRIVTSNVISNYFANEIDNNLRFIADHTPSNLKIAKSLAKSYPKSKFIHLIRDGRGVFASVKNVTWGPNIPTDAATWWLSELSFCFLAEAEGIPIIRVHYEDLVKRPKEELDRIFDFLNLKPDYVLSERGNYKLPEYTKEQHRLVGQKPDISKVDDWQERLTIREIELFERGTYGMLENLGYKETYKKIRKISNPESVKLKIIDAYLKIKNKHKQRNKLK